MWRKGCYRVFQSKSERADLLREFVGYSSHSLCFVRESLLPLSPSLSSFIQESLPLVVYPGIPPSRRLSRNLSLSSFIQESLPLVVYPGIPPSLSSFIQESLPPALTDPIDTSKETLHEESMSYSIFQSKYLSFVRSIDPT